MAQQSVPVDGHTADTAATAALLSSTAEWADVFLLEHVAGGNDAFNKLTRTTTDRTFAGSTAFCTFVTHPKLSSVSLGNILRILLKCCNTRIKKNNAA